MTTGELIGRIYDLSANKLMRVAVDIKEHPKRSAFRYHDFPAVKAAFEKVLDIRGPERQRVRDYYYCCQAYRSHPTGRRVVTVGLVGLEDDFEIAKRIYLYAHDCVISAIKHNIKKNPTDPPGTYRERCNAYGWGFVSGVDAAFREQEEDHKDWGLVLVVPQAVTDSMADMGKKSSFGKDKNNHADCKAAGYQEGRKFDPTRRVAGGPERMVIGGEC